MKPSYSVLHCHSHYSLLDGISKPSQIAKRCEDIGVNSCAITDHGSISGCVQFYSAMAAKKIKPILGCEMYLCKEDSKIKTKENSHLSHFIILAKNLKGWKTLIKIISESNLEENFYHKPRLSLDRLSEMLDGNIIGFCGHIGSYIHDLIKITERENMIKESTEFVYKMKDVFGKDNFFLESQLMDAQNNKEQISLTEFIRDIGQKTDTRVVCTPDAHYCEKKDAVDQRVLLCNSMKTTLSDISSKILNDEDIPLGCFFKSDNYHILSNEEMYDIHTEEEINNTIYLSSLIEDYNILQKPSLPPFDCPNGQNPDEYLRQLCRNGWREKILNIIPVEHHDEYTNRIKYELEILQQAGLSSYFLIVEDIVKYIKGEKWLPGPGRGSAAGCLVSYLLGITSIDPIKYNLIFERFYNSGRNSEGSISMPDIDVDVPINKRENIINYIRNKYGSDKVSQIITYNTMKGRGALKEVLRVYGDVPFEEMNRITKNIPDEAKIADELQEMKQDTGEASIIRWALENNVEKLKEWCSISEDGSLVGPLCKRFEQAIRLEGIKSNQSKHAAGVVISSTELRDICPMIYDAKNNQHLGGMEMQDLENLGIIKFDILGIAMLDKVMIISDILKNGE